MKKESIIDFHVCFVTLVKQHLLCNERQILETFHESDYAIVVVWYFYVDVFNTVIISILKNGYYQIQNQLLLTSIQSFYRYPLESTVCECLASERLGTFVLDLGGVLLSLFQNKLKYYHKYQYVNDNVWLNRWCPLE